MSREKKFTKGPWAVLSSDNEDLFIEKHKILTVTSVKTSDVNFQIEVMDASDDNQKAESTANLIAAAPELLEALEDVLNLIDCFEMRSCPHIKEDGGCGGEDEDCDWLANSKKAIKKAYGETE